MATQSEVRLKLSTRLGHAMRAGSESLAAALGEQ